MSHALVARARTGDLSGMETLCTKILESPLIGEAVTEKIIGLCRISLAVLSFGRVEQGKDPYLINLYLIKMIFLTVGAIEYIEGNYEKALSWVAETHAVEKQMEAGDFLVDVSFALEARALLGLAPRVG
jgi:hypothetical protein